MSMLRPSAVLAALLVVACADAPVQPVFDGNHDHSPLFAHEADHSPAQNQLNAEIRRATARYQRIDAALADGYVLASGCVPGMGYHYLKNSLLNGVVDPSQPEILVYVPQVNGRLRLGAVEFVVPAAAWDPFNDGPPTLGSRAFDDHRAPGSAGPPFPHYQLHAWVWMHNPSGIYSPFNPESSCEFAS